MFVGFGVMFVTGVLLFAARATDAYESPYFRFKVALLVLGGVNIVMFHTTVDRRRDEWDAPEAHHRCGRGLPAACRWCCGSPSSPRAESWPTTCDPPAALDPLNRRTFDDALVLLSSLARRSHSALTSGLAWPRPPAASAARRVTRAAAVLPGVTMTVTNTETVRPATSSRTRPAPIRCRTYRWARTGSRRRCRASTHSPRRASSCR